jgi:mannonate dehydratase
MKLVEKLVVDSSLTDENMAYLKQMGVNHLTVAVLEMGTREPERKSFLSRLRENAYYELDDLVALKKWAESHGLELSAVSSPSFRNWGKIFFGQPGRDEQIEHWIKTLRNMGKAGIYLLQNTWVLNAGAWIPLWRTSVENVGRGGAKIERFDNTLAQNAPMTSYGTLSDLIYFLKAVIPVAEESGVTMTVHPCDPQVPSIAGIARIIRSIASYDRLFGIVPSKALKVTICLGCFAQMMEPAAVYRTIRYFGRQGRIGHVHFRGVRGSLEKFDEVFPDEGKLDMIKAMKTLKQAGYTGLVQPDHAPRTTGDTKYGHASRAFQIGYLKGVLQGAGALD